MQLISTYDLLTFSIIAAKEKHPDWKINQDMEQVMFEGCKEIDEACSKEFLDMRTEVTEDGDAVVTIREPETGDPLRTWIMEGVFITE